MRRRRENNVYKIVVVKLTCVYVKGGREHEEHSPKKMASLVKDYERINSHFQDVGAL